MEEVILSDRARGKPDAVTLGRRDVFYDHFDFSKKQLNRTVIETLEKAGKGHPI